MRKRVAAFMAVVLLAAMGTQIVTGDGTEQLGTPGIGIADGTDVIAAGTGTLNVPSDINLTVPAGASVEQVLLYWEGQHIDAGDDTISVDGNSVTGTLIGGPTAFFEVSTPSGRRDVHSSTYRADITGLGLVGTGANTLTIDDMAFDFANSGAGVLVIVDNGTANSIELRDGSDLAFINFDPPLDTTVPQTFNFAAAASDRAATLDMFFSSVAGDASGSGNERPSSIEVESGGVITTFSNILDSNDGQEWDTLELLINVPAGATSLTVQAFSRDDLNTREKPASFAWNAAALTLPLEEQEEGGEGCTPGFWRQEHHYDSWTTYSPNDLFDDVFGVDAPGNLTLGEAVELGGGGAYALMRHAVAALLNAESPDVAYNYTSSEVIQRVQDAFASDDFENHKDALEEANENGCDLGGPNGGGAGKNKLRSQGDESKKDNNRGRGRGRGR